jgi:hypothetical protein
MEMCCSAVTSHVHHGKWVALYRKTYSLRCNFRFLFHPLCVHICRRRSLSTSKAAKFNQRAHYVRIKVDFVLFLSLSRHTWTFLRHRETPLFNISRAPLTKKIDLTHTRSGRRKKQWNLNLELRPAAALAHCRQTIGASLNGEWTNTHTRSRRTSLSHSLGTLFCDQRKSPAETDKCSASTKRSAHKGALRASIISTKTLPAPCRSFSTPPTHQKCVQFMIKRVCRCPQ